MAIDSKYLESLLSEQDDLQSQYAEAGTKIKELQELRRNLCDALDGIGNKINDHLRQHKIWNRSE